MALHDGDGTIGPDGRKRKSGSKYEKEREENKIKQAEVIVKKILSFGSPQQKS